MDNPVCQNCSTPLPDGSKYCSECGTPVPTARVRGSGGTTPSPPPVSPPTADPQAETPPTGSPPPGGADPRSETPPSGSYSLGGDAPRGRPAPVEGRAESRPGGLSGDLRQALQEATAGEYEIHHELGRGGMGSVYLAREIGLDRLVAIKVLPPTLMFDPGLIERFQREARMVAKLHHPHIIPVYRVHHSHNLVFYTMHFVPGRTLSELIGSGRVMPIGEVERLLLEAAAGLGYAHKRDVIHRDVKPANILLDVEGHAHLTDFGIAKALGVGSTHLTDTGALIGTPQYMAPEQCEGRMVDGRADQYSLAAVGYQMLVGHPPFESVSVKELLYHHLFTPPRALNNLRPDIPPPLRDAIHKALSKDPADRFDSVEDFSAAVEGKGPPVFVKWLDDPRERWRTPPGGVTLRRSTDLPNPRRISQAEWSSSDAVERREPQLYRRVAGAVMVAAVTVSIVGVLALSQNGDLRERLQSRWGGTSTETGESTAPAQMVLGSNGEALEEQDAATSPASSPEPGDAAAGERSEAVHSFGILAIRGAPPEGARWSIDGEEQLGSPRGGTLKELRPGPHRIEIRASGYQMWSGDINLQPGDTLEIAPQLEPIATRPEPPRTAARSEPTVRRTQPASTPAPPPRVPQELLDELRKLMGEARQFFDIAAYQDAIDTYADVINRALEARAKYAQSDDLDSLRRLAESRQDEARRVCREKGLTCT